MIGSGVRTNIALNQPIAAGRINTVVAQVYAVIDVVRYGVARDGPIAGGSNADCGKTGRTVARQSVVSNRKSAVISGAIHDRKAADHDAFLHVVLYDVISNCDVMAAESGPHPDGVVFRT